MEWIPTPQSSNIRGFAFDENTNVLTVEFNNGGRYNYFDVPMGVYEAMKVAPSIGQFLAQNVKGTYRYARV
jgi:KTSC domain